MTTEKLQALGERVAQDIGWRQDEQYRDEWHDKNERHHLNPSDPGEALRLAAEYNVWPNQHHGLSVHFMAERIREEVIRVINDNTPEGRLNAWIECVLLAVLRIEEEKQCT